MLVRVGSRQVNQLISLRYTTTILLDAQMDEELLLIITVL